MCSEKKIRPGGTVINNIEVSSQQPVQCVGEKNVVFEKSKNRKGDYQAQRQPCFLTGLCLCIINGEAYKEVNDGGKQQNHYKQSAGFVIEEQGNQPQVKIS